MDKYKIRFISYMAGEIDPKTKKRSKTEVSFIGTILKTTEKQIVVQDVKTGLIATIRKVNLIECLKVND